MSLNLENKTVCIVSYAFYMYNKNLGKIIDSYDFVLRINNGIHNLNSNDFGEKNTIASFSMSKGKTGIVEQTYKVIFKKKKNFLNICKEYGFLYVIGIINDLEDEYWKNFLIDNKNIYDCITKFNKNYSYLKIMGLTCGLHSIIFILKNKPEKLFICGFDFSLNLHPDYAKFYPIPSNLNKSYEEIQKNWHSSVFERYLLKKLYLNYNFLVDNELQKILDKINTENFDNNVFYAIFKGKLEFNYIYKEAFDIIREYIDS